MCIPFALMSFIDKLICLFSISLNIRMHHACFLLANKEKNVFRCSIELICIGCIVPFRFLFYDDTSLEIMQTTAKNVTRTIANIEEHPPNKINEKFSITQCSEHALTARFGSNRSPVGVFSLLTHRSNGIETS